MFEMIKRIVRRLRGTDVVYGAGDGMTPDINDIRKMTSDARNSEKQLKAKEKEARKRAKLVSEEYSTIMRCIENTARDGKEDLYVRYHIYDENKERLESNGYKVEYLGGLRGDTTIFNIFEPHTHIWWWV